MIYVVIIFSLIIAYNALRGNLTRRKYQKLIRVFAILTTGIILFKFGPNLFLIVGSLIFCLLSLLPKNVDTTNFFRFFGGYASDFHSKNEDFFYERTSESKYNMSKEEALKILGLSENASEKEIKNAYLKLIAKFHPDKSEGSDYFATKINQARDVLIKKKK